MRKKTAATRRTPGRPRPTTQPDTRIDEAIRFIGNIVSPLVHAVIVERADERAHELTILEKDREYALKRLECRTRPAGETLESLFERFNEFVQSAASVQAVRAAQAARANGSAEHVSDESEQAQAE